MLLPVLRQTHKLVCLPKRAPAIRARRLALHPATHLDAPRFEPSLSESESESESDEPLPDSLLLLLEPSPLSLLLLELVASSVPVTSSSSSSLLPPAQKRDACVCSGGVSLVRVLVARRSVQHGGVPPKQQPTILAASGDRSKLDNSQADERVYQSSSCTLELQTVLSAPGLSEKRASRQCVQRAI